jgi:hypothetical protein
MEVAIFLYRSIISKKGIRYTDSDYPLWYLQIPLNNIIRSVLASQPQVIKFTRCQVAYGRWFSPGTPASSTTKTGRHDIAEILLKAALKYKKSIKIQ